jgi:hypothetical protein
MSFFTMASRFWIGAMVAVLVLVLAVGVTQLEERPALSARAMMRVNALVSSICRLPQLGQVIYDSMIVLSETRRSVGTPIASSR